MNSQDASLNNDVVTQHVYIILDTFYNDAFGHWVYEGGIYLPIISHIKETYPGAKVVLNKEIKYKNLFVNYFGFTDDDIVYDIAPPNLCFFPIPQICSLNRHERLQEYRYLVTNFMNVFDDIQFEKKYEITIMPRHKTGNFYMFDRTIDTMDIEKILSTSPQNFVFDTSKVLSLIEHMTPIKQSKTIIIPDGSSFLVNAMFAYNSRIIVLGCQTCFQAIDHASVKLFDVIDHITTHNEIVYVSKTIEFGSRKETHSYSDIEKFIVSNDLSELCHVISKNIYVAKDVSENCSYTMENLRRAWKRMT